MSGVIIDVKTKSEEARRDLDHINDSLRNIDETTKKTAASLTNMVKGLGAVIASSLSISYLLNVSNTFGEMANKIALVTGRTSELRSTQKDLLNIVRETRSTIDNTVSSFSTLGRTMKATADNAGASMKDLLTATRAINEAVVVSGAGADSARAAVVQLGQGLASGVLRGEELNSVMEQTPRLAQAIADELGVSLGQLRKIAAVGELTSTTVFKALVNQSAAISSEFAKMTPTIGQGIAVLKQSVSVYVNEVMRGLAGSKSLASVMVNISNSIYESSDTIALSVSIQMGRIKLYLAAVGGLLSSFGAVFKAIGQQIIDALPVVAYMGSLKEDVLSILYSISDRVTKIFDYLGTQIGRFLKDTFNWDSSVEKALRSIGRIKFSFDRTSLMQYSVAFKELATAISENSNSIGAKYYRLVDSMTSATVRFLTYFGFLPAGIRVATGDVAGLVSTVAELTRGLTNTQKKIWDIGTIFSDTFGGRFAEIRSAISDIVDKYLPSLSGISSWTKDVTSKAAVMVTSTLGMISSFSDKVIYYFWNIYDKVIGHSWWTDTMDSVVSQSAALLGKTRPYLDRFSDYVLNIFRNIKEKSENFINNKIYTTEIKYDLSINPTAVQEVEHKLSALYIKFKLHDKDYLESLISSAGSRISAMASIIKDTFSSKENMVDFFSSIVNKITDTLDWISIEFPRAFKTGLLVVSALAVKMLFPAGLIATSLMAAILSSLAVTGSLAAERFGSDLFGGSFLTQAANSLGNLVGYFVGSFISNIPQILNALLGMVNGFVQGFISQMPIIGGLIHGIFSVLNTIPLLGGTAGIVGLALFGSGIAPLLMNIKAVKKATEFLVGKEFAKDASAGLSGMTGLLGGIRNFATGNSGVVSRLLFGLTGSATSLFSGLGLITVMLGGVDSLLGGSKIAKLALEGGLLLGAIMGKEGYIKIYETVITRGIMPLMGSIQTVLKQTTFGTNLIDTVGKLFSGSGSSSFWIFHLRKTISEYMSKAQEIIVTVGARWIGAGSDWLITNIFGDVATMNAKFSSTRSSIIRLMVDLGARLMKIDLFKNIFNISSDALSKMKTSTSSLANIFRSTFKPVQSEFDFSPKNDNVKPGTQGSFNFDDKELKSKVERTVAANSTILASNMSTITATATAGIQADAAVAAKVGPTGIMGTILNGKAGKLLLLGGIGAILLIASTIASATENANKELSVTETITHRLVETIKTAFKEHPVVALSTVLLGMGAMIAAFRLVAIEFKELVTAATLLSAAGRLKKAPADIGKSFLTSSTLATAGAVGVGAVAYGITGDISTGLIAGTLAQMIMPKLMTKLAGFEAIKMAIGRAALWISTLELGAAAATAGVVALYATVAVAVVGFGYLLFKSVDRYLTNRESTWTDAIKYAFNGLVDKFQNNPITAEQNYRPQLGKASVTAGNETISTRAISFEGIDLKAVSSKTNRQLEKVNAEISSAMDKLSEDAKILGKFGSTTVEVFNKARDQQAEIIADARKETTDKQENTIDKYMKDMQTTQNWAVADFIRTGLNKTAGLIYDASQKQQAKIVERSSAKLDFEQSRLQNTEIFAQKDPLWLHTLFAAIIPKNRDTELSKLVHVDTARFYALKANTEYEDASKKLNAIELERANLFSKLSETSLTDYERIKGVLGNNSIDQLLSLDKKRVFSGYAEAASAAASTSQGLKFDTGNQSILDFSNSRNLVLLKEGKILYDNSLKTQEFAQSVKELNTSFEASGSTIDKAFTTKLSDKFSVYQLKAYFDAMIEINKEISLAKNANEASILIAAKEATDKSAATFVRKQGEHGASASITGAETALGITPLTATQIGGLSKAAQNAMSSAVSIFEQFDITSQQVINGGVQRTELINKYKASMAEEDKQYTILANKLSSLTSAANQVDAADNSVVVKAALERLNKAILLKTQAEQRNSGVSPEDKAARQREFDTATADYAKRRSDWNINNGSAGVTSEQFKLAAAAKDELIQRADKINSLGLILEGLNNSTKLDLTNLSEGMRKIAVDWNEALNKGVMTEAERVKFIGDMSFQSNLDVLKGDNSSRKSKNTALQGIGANTVQPGYSPQISARLEKLYIKQAELSKGFNDKTNPTSSSDGQKLEASKVESSFIEATSKRIFSTVTSVINNLVAAGAKISLDSWFDVNPNKRRELTKLDAEIEHYKLVLNTAGASSMEYAKAQADLAKAEGKRSDSISLLNRTLTTFAGIMSDIQSLSLSLTVRNWLGLSDKQKNDLNDDIAKLTEIQRISQLTRKLTSTEASTISTVPGINVKANDKLSIKDAAIAKVYVEDTSVKVGARNANDDQRLTRLNQLMSGINVTMSEFLKLSQGSGNKELDAILTTLSDRFQESLKAGDKGSPGQQLAYKNDPIVIAATRRAESIINPSLTSSHQLYNSLSGAGISQFSELNLNRVSLSNADKLKIQLAQMKVWNDALVTGFNADSTPLKDTMRKKTIQMLSDAQAKAAKEIEAASVDYSALARAAGENFATGIQSDVTSSMSKVLSGKYGRWNELRDELLNNFTSRVIDTFVSGFMTKIMGKGEKSLSGMLESLGGGLFGIGVNAADKTGLIPKGSVGDPMYVWVSNMSLGTATSAAVPGLSIPGVSVSDMTRTMPNGRPMLTGASTDNMNMASNAMDYGTAPVIDGFKGMQDTQNIGNNINSNIEANTKDAKSINFNGFAMMGGLLTAMLASGGGVPSNEAIILGAVVSGATMYAGRHALGGLISGPGTGTSDSIHAMLSNKEFVVNAKSTAKFLPLLTMLNNDKLPGFANGGFVGGTPNMLLSGGSIVSGRNSRSTNNSTFNINVTGDISRQTRQEIQGMIPQIATGVNMHNYEIGYKGN